MSISPAAVQGLIVPTTSPAAPGTASTQASLGVQPASNAPPVVARTESSLLVWIILGWSAAGLMSAARLGFFRRRSIVGPVRIASGQAAWDLLFVLLMGYLAGVAVATSTNRGQHFSTQSQTVVVNLAFEAATLGTILIALRLRQQGAITQLGLGLRNVPVGLLGGAVSLFILYPMIQLTGQAVLSLYSRMNVEARTHPILQLLGNSPSRRLNAAAIFLAVILVPLTEELLFRGLLQTVIGQLFVSLGEFLSPAVRSSPSVPEYRSDARPAAQPTVASRWAAVLVTAALFAAVHNNWAFVPPLFLLAVGLGYVYERTGNLWITITTHALFNVGQILLYMAAPHS
jgi:membrane protease YdiL (CAAX protease family)